MVPAHKSCTLHLELFKSTHKRKGNNGTENWWIISGITYGREVSSMRAGKVRESFLEEVNLSYAFKDAEGLVR